MITRTYAFTDARITKGDNTLVSTIDPEAHQWTFDGTWSPYVQGSFVIAAPQTDVSVTAIEPRNGQRFRGTLRQTSESGATVDLSFDLGLRSRAQSYRAGTMTCNFASLEALAQDYGFPTAKTWSGDKYSTDVAREALSWYGSVLSVSTAAANPLIPAADAGCDPGTTSWDWASQMAEGAGARFFCDETANFWWTEPTWVADTSLFTLDDSTGILDVEDVVSRDDPAWGNAAVVAYTGNSPTQYVDSSAGIEPRKTLVVQRARRKPAGNAATKIRTTAAKRGRTLRVTAIADLRARPNQAWQVIWGGITKTGVVQSVNHDFPTGLMTLLVNVTES